MGTKNQVKTKVRYQFIPMRIACIKKKKNLETRDVSEMYKEKKPGILQVEMQIGTVFVEIIKDPL